MKNETVHNANDDIASKLDELLARTASIEERLDALQQAPSRQLDGAVSLALSGMTDDMLKGLVRKISGVAEVVLDPGVLALLDRFKDPEVQMALDQLTDASTLETVRGLTGALSLMKSGMTDEMVAGLVRKIGVLAELILDPFVIDAIQRAARALKAGQAQYPDVKVPPVGGIFGALRSANDPDTRRVMAFALAVMQNLGHEFA
jgi:uncharacterized protein YjgD (DUF1641 family)